jgi:hypothetical protein
MGRPHADLELEHLAEQIGGHAEAERAAHALQLRTTVDLTIAAPA